MYTAWHIANNFIVDSMKVYIFVGFHIVASESEAKIVEPALKTDFNRKWHLKVIQGHTYQSHFSICDECLYVAKLRMQTSAGPCPSKGTSV